MNEENEFTKNIEPEENIVQEFEEQNRSLSSQSKVMIGVAVAALLLISAGLIWYFTKSEGERPVPAPRDVSFNDAKDGESSQSVGDQKVELTDEQLKAANLKIVTVGEGFDKSPVATNATGVVQPNDYKETPVISLVGGVIRNVNTELGQFVRAGQTVATVYSDELARAESDYLSKLAVVQESDKAYRRSLELTEIASESRNEINSSAAQLKIAEAEHEEHFSHFERSKKLLAIGAESREEFEMIKTKHQSALAKLEEAKNRFARAKKLLDINPARRAEQDAMQRQLATAKSELASMKQRLLVLGLSIQTVNSLTSPERINSLLPIVSPVSGTVTMRQINEGQTIMANSELLKITNLSSVWVIGQVYEKDLASLRIGSGASVTSDAFTGEVFRGNVSYIDPNLDQNTRTAQVRIELPNAGERLKIGMYVNIAFATLTGSENTVPMIPKEAVQTINGRQTVFVATDDPKVFLLRTIRIGAESKEMFPVLEGLFVGDKIVTDGSFLLRAEMMKTNPNGL